MRRVLVIDNDPAIRLLYEEELSEEGYEVISSAGGRGLVQLIAAKSPDLILLDLKPRSQSALDSLQRIRKVFPCIPLIVTTADPVQKDAQLLDADAYVTKSSDLTKVKQQIKKRLATAGPLYEKGIITGEEASRKVMGPAVQLCMPFRNRSE
jgi:two-component system response regulator (stage 0 sporulation protein F)